MGDNKDSLPNPSFVAQKSSGMDVETQTFDQIILRAVESIHRLIKARLPSLITTQQGPASTSMMPSIKKLDTENSRIGRSAVAGVGSVLSSITNSDVKEVV